MKKATLFAFGCAMLAGTAMAQNAQEVTYVEDPSQGYLFNKFSDNWFIQAEGGVTLDFNNGNIHNSFGKRLAPAASLYVGKWFSPILGARIGADFMSIKGLNKSAEAEGSQAWQPTVDGRYVAKKNYFGPSFDVMLNLTNWWCGYRPGRIYNAYIYAGGGIYWGLTHQQTSATKKEWKSDHNRTLMLRAGLTQEFNLCKNFALGLDLRVVGAATRFENPVACSIFGEALITATYKFNSTTWSAPIVPVCPPAENCDEYRALLQAADARIADLEAQLKACLSRPVETVVEKEVAPLATIYYPINAYRLTSVDRKVLSSVANAMKASGKDYVLTGWADNYTGSANYNVGLRQRRVDGVKAQLLKNGVPDKQLTATTNNANRTDLGDKCLTLDRCVTIVEK